MAVSSRSANTTALFRVIQPIAVTAADERRPSAVQVAQLTRGMTVFASIISVWQFYVWEYAYARLEVKRGRTRIGSLEQSRS